MSEIPLHDQKEFDAWLRARWSEKDDLLDKFYETGRFPSDLAGTIDTDDLSANRKAAAAAGYAETHVRVSHWAELFRIFAVLIGIAFLCRLPALWRSG